MKTLQLVNLQMYSREELRQLSIDVQRELQSRVHSLDCPSAPGKDGAVRDFCICKGYNDNR